MSQLFASELNLAQNYYPQGQQAPQPYQNQPQYAPQPQYQAPQNYAPAPQPYQQGAQMPQNPYPAQNYQQPQQYAPQGQYPAQQAAPAEPYYPQQAPQQYAQPQYETQPQYQQAPQYQQYQSPQPAPQPQQPQYAPPAQPVQNQPYQQRVAPQNPPARQSAQSYGGTQTQRNGDMFVGIGVLGGLNGTTFNNTDFEPTDFGLYLRIGRQHSIARTYLSYTYIDHSGDDDNWVKVGSEQYKAKSHIFSFNVDLMPKLPSSPLYGILGFDVGWERFNLEYRDTRGFNLGDLFESRLISASGSINGLNLGIKGGFAVELTPNFQLELTGRISKSFLQKIEDTYINDKPDQMNLTGMIGLNIVF